MANLNDRLRQLRTIDPKISVALNADNESVTAIRGVLSGPADLAKVESSPFETARQFIKQNRELFGAIDEVHDLVDGRVMTDPQHDRLHVVFAQKHGEATVLGGILSIHFEGDGAVHLVKSTLASHIDLPKAPSITAEKAMETARADVGQGGEGIAKIASTLVVADAHTVHLERLRPRHYLCWRVAVTSKSGDWIYLVNALTNKVLLRYPADRTGSGVGEYSTGTTLNTEKVGTLYRLRDVITSAPWSPTKPSVSTYDDAGATSTGHQDYSVDPDDHWDGADQHADVDVHRFLGYTLEYFYNTFGYDGWDGSGLEARGHAHNEKYPNNAYWSQSEKQVFFADGDAVHYGVMTPIDVVVHEFCHGVKYYNDVLQTYDGETGALDESTNDVFGALVSLLHPADNSTPWMHGKQYHIDGKPGRNLADPSRDPSGVVKYDATSDATKYASMSAGYYPDHYSIRYQGASDAHGVHINSTIISHAMYLMVNGGTHRLSNVHVNGIGVAAVEQMLWETISGGLLSNASTFADFRHAFLEACQSLYPENLDHLATVKAAFRAVGVGPDLYVRDTLGDQGDEPGIASCMSPDIIVRRTPADAATLAQISDLNNGSLCDTVDLHGGDQPVYFRVFNRGSAVASGTFRLFMSPASSFPTPATWHEVGHYDFTNVAANNGVFVPTAAGQCITIPQSLIATLGAGHFCFIGVIESGMDPAPDRMLINSSDDFYAFIGKSNNYAWRNCDIVDVSADSNGEYDATKHEFVMNHVGRRGLADLEIDTRDLPPGTELLIGVPTSRARAAKIFEAVSPARLTLKKIAGSIVRTSAEPKSKAVTIGALTPAELLPDIVREWSGKSVTAMRLLEAKITRLSELPIAADDPIPIHFTIKFPRDVGRRDVTLTFRQRRNDKDFGQMNFLFRIR